MEHTVSELETISIVYSLIHRTSRKSANGFGQEVIGCREIGCFDWLSVLALR